MVLTLIQHEVDAFFAIKEQKKRSGLLLRKMWW